MSFRVVFEGGFLGSARNFWGNPYLNSMTVLFDTMGAKTDDILQSFRLSADDKRRYETNLKSTLLNRGILSIKE